MDLAPLGNQVSVVHVKLRGIDLTRAARLTQRPFLLQTFNCTQGGAIDNGFSSRREDSYIFV